MKKMKKEEQALIRLLRRDDIRLSPDIIRSIKECADKDVLALAKTSGIPELVWKELGKKIFNLLVEKPIGRFIIYYLLREDLLNNSKS